MCPGRYLASTATVALAFGLAVPALAQQATPSVPPAEAPVSQASGSTPQAGDAGLADIVVTAQRREENLQRAAIAVSAVQGEDLLRANVTDVTQLSRLVPSLSVQPVTGTATAFYIRGVGSLVGNAFTEDPVAFNYGQVYIARPAALFGTLYDLQRIEVLKGPQGTLYGRNATGGAVNVIPNRPAIGTNSLDLSIETGNYQSIHPQAAVNLSLGDNAALRLAGQIASRQGFYNDGYDDDNGQAVRASFLFKPNKRFSALIMADYFHQGGNGPGSALVPGPLTPTAPALSDRVDGAEPRSIAALRASFGPLVDTGLILAPRLGGYVNGNFWGVSADIEYDFGGATLTLIPAYRESRPNYLSYSGGYSALVDEQSRQTSVEARLTSDGNGALKYVIGAYYFRERQTGFNDFDTGLIARTLFDVDLHNRSYAVFGQTSYAVADGFRLVAGGRYTWEDKTQDTNLTSFSFGAATTSAVTGKANFKRFTYKGGFEWDVGEHNLLYANVASGFKSGGFFVAALDNTFQPESLVAYTAGSKNRFLDNRLQLNVEGFYWDYKNQQVNFIGPIRNGDGTTGVGLVTTNAGKSRMFGTEVELSFQLTRRDLFSADVQYLDGKYTQYSYVASSPAGTPPRSSCLVTPSNAFTLPPPGQAYLVNCSGKPQINSPRWSSQVQYEHRFAIGATEVTLGGRAKLETSRYVAPEYLPEEQQKAYGLVDAFVTIALPDSHVSLTGFVNNITNRALIAGAQVRPIVPVVYGILLPPRTYGLRLTGHF